LKRVLSARPLAVGGARDEAWARIRTRILGMPLGSATQNDSAVGAALPTQKGGPAGTGWDP
jgi:sugar (pentulose or hexulose) kinase